MFYIGQKVVCINNKWFLRDLMWATLYPPSCSANPVVGTVYTVAAVHREYGLAIELVELPSPEDEHWGAGFLACDFRPVVERKTDISVFQKLLQPKSEKVG